MTDEIARASGQVGIFEAERLRYRVVRLVIGRGLFGWPATLAVFACLAVVGSNWLSNYLDDDDTITTLVAIWLPVVIIGFAGLVVLRGLKGRNHRAWYARGVPQKIELAYAVTDAGLRVRSELYDSTIYWQSFNEVSLAGDSWLLLNAGCAYYLPRRFFATPAEERAFIAAMIERLSPDAKQRSRKATEFLS